jgi:hypothetical protein
MLAAGGRSAFVLRAFYSEKSDERYIGPGYVVYVIQFADIFKDAASSWQVCGLLRTGNRATVDHTAFYNDRIE